jgi:hypothetical protein
MPNKGKTLARQNAIPCSPEDVGREMAQLEKGSFVVHWRNPVDDLIPVKDQSCIASG